MAKQCAPISLGSSKDVHLLKKIVDLALGCSDVDFQVSCLIKYTSFVCLAFFRRLTHIITMAI